ncbi:MAG: hypothetical protein L0312_20120 [Acidobacteria bacterium]|nr:hypothetical protein [Acidobacteriota bacterium]
MDEPNEQPTVETPGTTPAEPVKGGISKAQMVKDLLAIEPDLKADEVISRLAAQGIQISKNIVYGVRRTLSKKPTTKTKPRLMRRTIQEVGARTDTKDLVKLLAQFQVLVARFGGLQKLCDALVLIEAVGGIKAARGLIDAISAVK